MKLLIVESPAKSKTIKQYLGDNFVVESSLGHIRDLSIKGKGGFGVDIENNFQPQYVLIKEKAEVVERLKKAAEVADHIYLATDPDREGEAISWHLKEVLGGSEEKFSRVVFNEITKKAILKGIENDRNINMDLVHSQESRRILDRIIGFRLSSLLQQKIASKSAGRVQSVALKLINDREKEIEAFVPEEYWEIYATFLKNNQELKAKFYGNAGGKITIRNAEENQAILEALEGADYKVAGITKKQRNRSAKPPFITSTLQQDAGVKFNFNARRVMIIAQKLYEGVDIGN
ncbi:MAG: DNA topoisomerase, partial [Bacilli bacterium]